MGYDLHITRRKDWSDTGGDITAEEWLAFVRGDPELHLRPETGPHFAEWMARSESNAPWLDWCDGQVYAKNPDPALIDKMVAIARSLHATVQGDDGELYDGARQSPLQPETALAERVADWFSRFRSKRPSKIEHNPLPFGVGDRVRDVWGNQHTVIRIDPSAEHGMGVIRIRRDDGTELNHAMIAHGLTPDKPARNPDGD